MYDWPHDDATFAEGVEHDLLALRLRRAERRRAVFWVPLEQRRCRLVEPLLEVRVVDAGGRREDVLTDVALEQRRWTGAPSQGLVAESSKTASHFFPSSALSWPLRSPTSPLDLGRQHAVVASAAREDGHLVAARDRVLNEVGSDEPGAAEDEDAHGRARGCGRSGGQEAGRAGADEHRTADGGGGLQEIASAGHLLGKGWVG
jgi:hypothetical protein